jgi:hypothetical protein
MSRRLAGFTRGAAGPDLQALLSYAYAVQCLRARQQQALGKLAWHALQAVSGQNLAIGAVRKSELCWLAAVGQSAGDNEKLALPRQIADLELSSFGVDPVAGTEPGQYPVHVYPGADNVPSTAYVLIGRGSNLEGVLAICRHTTDDFSENDVRMLRIFAMSVDQVLAWSPSHPVPEGLDEIGSVRRATAKSAVLPPEIADSRSKGEPQSEFSLFEVEDATSRLLGLKMGVAVMTLALAGLASLALYERKPEQPHSQAVTPQVSEAMSPAIEKAAPIAVAGTPSQASVQPIEAPPQGLRVENPDPGITVWQPAGRSNGPVRLEQVRLRRQQDQVFLIFELTGDTGLRIEHFKNPEKVSIRFAGAKMSKKLTLRGIDPMIAGFSAKANARGSEVEIKLSRHANVMLVGPTAAHHVIINIQG